MYAIDTIKVYNREDCCASRLADFTVTILREDIVEWSTLVTGNAPYLSTISVPSIIGSVVRISLSGENLVLSLAEVEVFGTVAPRSIIFRNAANNNLCLDVYRNQYFNGNKVWLYTCNNTAAQKWKVNSKGEITIGDNYEFCLSGGTGGLYTPSFIWKCNDVESHIWKELGSIGSTGRITSQKYNKSIGVGNGCGGVASQRKVELQGYMSSGMCSMQQKWKLEEWFDTEPNGNFVLLNPSTGKALDVQGSKCDNGTNIHLWSRNDSGAQIFRYDTVTKQIINVKCNKAVDLSGAGGNTACDPGRNILLWSPHSGSNQKWDLEPDGTIRSVQCPNLVVDILGSLRSNGANLEAYFDNGRWDKVWVVTNV